MSLEDLSTANEKLRSQVSELQETVACLDTENQVLLKENQGIKDYNQSLLENADTFKARMEEMQKKVEDLKNRMDEANESIHQLEVQNKMLVEANEDLTKELHQVSYQVALFEDYKAQQERDLAEMQGLTTEVKRYMRSLEDRLAETEYRYQEARGFSAQLKDKVGLLLQLRESQRKDIKDLQGELEMNVQQATFLRLDQENKVQVGSLMHEVVEAKLVDVALNKSKKRRVLQWFCWLARILAFLMLGCLALLCLALMYTHFVNDQFIVDSMLMIFSDQSIDQIKDILSHFLIWSNDGLLPF